MTGVTFPAARRSIRKARSSLLIFAMKETIFLLPTRGSKGSQYQTLEHLSPAAPSGHDIDPVLAQRAPVVEDRMIGVGTEDQVVPLPVFGKIPLGVINDMVRANRSRRVHFPRAAHGGDFSPESLGDLDRECTHTSGGAVNQNLLASLDPSLVTKTLES